MPPVSNDDRHGNRRTRTIAARPDVLALEREALHRCFVKFANSFRDALDYAKREFSEIAYRFDCCRTAHDLLDVIGCDLFDQVAGKSRSHWKLLGSLFPRPNLREEDVAGVCGYHLVPTVARCVVQLLRGPLLRGLPADWRVMKSTLGRYPKGEQELREFWQTEILPLLKASHAKRFDGMDQDAWKTAREQVIACELMAELTREEETLAKRKWSAAEVDAAIEAILKQRRSRYFKLKSSIESGTESASESALRTARELFGRNALAKEIGCSAGSVSKSALWTKIKTDLQLPERHVAGRRARIGLGIAVEEKSDRAANPAPDKLSLEETKAVVRKVLPPNYAKLVCEQLDLGTISEDFALNIVEKCKQSPPNTSRKAT